ncbi:amino acid adenylation domain-containing protein [Streptantibioticus rubrisoli]|uniref:Amino acid adenylation domain-containing protein n=1 Tax=Streptantibioticus rubrisoli TaxID=1387313 RepID=A0ABT1PEA0_9ACTN|nr:amino acid adenylation domain-containing protein [Streptantibioticus rubrisoli]MCQ4042568.1 amino acid adenylation domain-containing protein [Streptantibioticus rubrisoli]
MTIAGATRNAEGPQDGCLHELFDAQAALRPRAHAAVHHGRALAYGELKAASEELAARLHHAGVRYGDTVGVLGNRSLEALVAFVGILKTGAAYVPLDDTSPPHRLQAMADEAGVQTVVTLPGSVRRLRRVRTHIDLAAPAPASPDNVPRPRTTPADCAYVMFTSGSTGRPKPVAVPHRGVVRLAVSDLVAQRPRPGERVLHAYGLSSDASTIEIWAALLGGGCLVLVDREDLLSPAVLEERLAAERVAIAYLTTGVFHHVARARPQALRTLRFASAGGEAMDPDLTRAVLAACPDTTVVNFYGPTENSVVSTAYVVRELPAGQQSVPIGRPLEHSVCHVLREDGTPAEVGEEGELFVGGEGLALGYLGDPELTAARFVERPVAPGTRLYRTGDRAVRREDGELEYRGRADRQIKLRGQRIELDEIEARLRADDAVGEAVVEEDGDTLTGYVTPAREAEAVPLDRVRKELAAWLPPAAVPARLVEVAQFPVTAAGKVDRRRLREVADRVAPVEVPGEHGPLADVWQTVLRAQPGADDDFFELGGDSLLAAEVVNRTLTALDIDARHGSTLVHSLLRHPTLRGYTAAVDAIQHSKSPHTSSPVDYRAEARLGFTLPTPRAPAPNWRRPRDVLLTGASGFVGAFLLDRLLRRTDARIHCPVRSRDRTHAEHRVTANLARYGLPRPPADRLVCFPADLAEEDLGLPVGHTDELADILDLVVHAAAQVNFLYPYDALRRANVSATKQLVRLAAQRAVPVHFLSTIAVVAGFGTAGVREVAEDLPLDHADRLTMGYAESKWVAEQSLQEAARQGLPIAVYRPYEVTGDRDTGACNTETAICSLFKTVAETGLAPDIPLPLDFVPADYLAEAVVRIATEQPATNLTYHLTNPRPATLHAMLDRMRAAGHQIRQLPYREWVDELVRHVARNPTSPTAPFVSLCVDRSHKADMSVKEMYFEGTFPTLGRTNVERAVGDLPCPPVDADLLDRYLEYFYATGYIERPTK